MRLKNGKGKEGMGRVVVKVMNEAKKWEGKLNLIILRVYMAEAVNKVFELELKYLIIAWYINFVLIV